MQKNRVSAEYPGVTRDSSPSCEQRQMRISLPSLHPGAGSRGFQFVLGTQAEDAVPV